MSIDLSGEWIFISRFLHPIAYPEDLTVSNNDCIETLVSFFFYLFYNPYVPFLKCII